MPITPNREYRVIPITQIETRDGENGEMIVEGYATTFNQRYILCSTDGFTIDEEVAPEAFNDADLTDVIMQYDHVGRIYARIRNRTLEVKPDEHGLKIRARLDGTELGRQLYQEIKGGYTDRMSMGFTTDKDTRTYETDHETGMEFVHRRIVAIKKLYDVSAVSIPANDTTEISARRFGDGVIAEIKAERLAAKQREREVLKIMTEV